MGDNGYWVGDSLHTQDLGNNKCLMVSLQPVWAAKGKELVWDCPRSCPNGLAEGVRRPCPEDTGGV